MKTLLALLALAQVSGYVYAPDGSVAADKIVRAGDKSAVTDKQGAFVITGLPDGVVEMNVESTTVFALTGDVVTIALNPPTEQDPSEEPPAPLRGDGTIEGRVTLDGKPLANAPVIVGEMRVVSNAKGELIAKGLPRMSTVVYPDERLSPRLRLPQEPFVVDLLETREASVEIALTSAPMIRGRVVDASGKPVADARVLLLPLNRSMPDLAPARTTPDGRFSFPAPEWPESEQVQISVVTSPLQSTTRSKAFRLGAEDREIEIALPKLETVRVRVLDRAGEAVPDAYVAFAPSAEDAFTSTLFLEGAFAQHALRANAEGEVVLQLAADTYDFAATADGFRTATLELKAIARPMTVDFTLQPAATLRGRVHRGDRAIADAAVDIVSPHDDKLRVHTDDDGRFEIEDLAPGPLSIRVFKEEELIDHTLDVEAPGTIDVALPPAGTLRGRVLDAKTGQSLPDFLYTISPLQTEPNARDTTSLRRAQSSADGTFTVELPPGGYRVSAGAFGYTSHDPTELHIVQNEITNLDLPLRRGAVVNGRVTDESGQPLYGATAMLVGTPRGPADLQRTPRVGPSHVLTDDDGRFSFAGLESEPMELVVQQTGYVSYRKTIQPEGTMALDIRLANGLSIQGMVTLGGKPLAGVQVNARSNAIGGEYQASFTDDDGRFIMTGLIHARYTISASHEENSGEVQDVDPTRQTEVVLSLDPKPRGVVYGTVTGIPPAPSLGGKYTRRVVSVLGENHRGEASIDDAGNYRIEDAPVGKVTLEAYVQSSAYVVRTSVPKQIEVVAGEPLRVDLDLGGNLRVSGRITMDGKPLAGVRVAFTNESMMTAGALTRDDGTYEVMLAAPGRHQITAQADQLTAGGFQTTREIRGGETIDLDLRERVIEGTVVDAATRQPIGGAVVTLANIGAPSSVAGEVFTDASGRFRIVAASAGTYRLIASAAGYAYRLQPIAVTTSQYALELSPAPDLAVRVLDSRTGAALDANVIVSDEHGIITARPRRRSGSAAYFFSLPPGKYRVTAEVSGYEHKVVEVMAPGAVDVVID